MRVLDRLLSSAVEWFESSEAAIERLRRIAAQQTDAAVQDGLHQTYSPPIPMTLSDIVIFAVTSIPESAAQK